jgi:hypothetical protein
MPLTYDATQRLSRTGKSLYAVLELKKGAETADIKKAYRFNALYSPLVSIPPTTFNIFKLYLFLKIYVFILYI